MLGLPPGSVEAFLVDRDLAQLLADREETQAADASDAVLVAPPPDPFAVVPDGLRGLTHG